MKLDEVIALQANQAQETATLEFKGGDALSRTDKATKELVKDITGMANAGGGILIYGLGEEKRDGKTFAGPLQTIRDDKITRDWLMQVVAANTGPPLGGYRVDEFVVSDADGGGRVFVVEIDMASTAHQSSVEHRYYQRIGTQVRPMQDFQVRDVMNRRMGPDIVVEFKKEIGRADSEWRRYLFTPHLANRGTVSLERWLLEIDLPKVAFEAADNPGLHLPRYKVAVEGVGFWRVQLSAQATAKGNAEELHPGRDVFLGQAIGLPTYCLRVGAENSNQLMTTRPPIGWHLYMPDARPLHGTVSFDSWFE